MRTEDFGFRLPPERIAQSPLEDRAASRLLWLPADGRTEHRRFEELPELLRPGDLLVRNDTRVVPARIATRRLDPATGRPGGRVEVLLLPPAGDERLSALTRPAVRPGTWLTVLGPDGGPGPDPRAGEAGSRGPARLEVGEPLEDGRREIRIAGDDDWRSWAERHGVPPLPPYIRRPAAASDRARYQTIYAREPGSVAAPTAGLHFDEPAFRKLRERGVGIRDLTLHVGYGTFAPVRAEDPREHRLASERFSVPAETREAVLGAAADGRRVVALGTTTVRALESLGPDGEAPPGGVTDRVILPGHRFRFVNALITNFHLPESSLLMLVCALAGTGRVLAAYREAARREYRFGSYGDAMLVEA